MLVDSIAWMSRCPRRRSCSDIWSRIACASITSVEPLSWPGANRRVLPLFFSSHRCDPLIDSHVRHRDHGCLVSQEEFVEELLRWGTISEEVAEGLLVAVVEDYTAARTHAKQRSVAANAAQHSTSVLVFMVMANFTNRRRFSRQQCTISSHRFICGM